MYTQAKRPDPTETGSLSLVWAILVLRKLNNLSLTYHNLN